MISPTMARTRACRLLIMRGVNAWLTKVRYWR